ncbi:MAG: family 10 glycosylhydrolase [Gemmatimonadetes bacterium]|nr:family 10 glycosylhydrolase [Gemmatimonadota bacterium]MDA1104044.1 family 10 glycosylhydrolase [Gemmatimonadota bacterium]
MRCRLAVARLVTAVVLAGSWGCTVVTTPVERPRPEVRVTPRPVGDPVVAVPDASMRPVREFAEVRALWVVRYTMTSESTVRDMVDRAERAGINTLIVQVRGRADAFYRSGLEPRAEPMRGEGGLDPLELTIQEAHRRGMAVHAWVNTHLVWGPAGLPTSPDHLVNAHPDWLSVPRGLGKELVAVDPFDPRFVSRLSQNARENSRTVEGIYSSPSHPDVQDRVHAVWMDLAERYDLDGIHFDYIRFPSGEYDYSIGALERFRMWVRGHLAPARFAELDGAYERDLYAFVDAERDRWAEFRREHVTRTVERIYRDIKARKPRLVVSAAVIADAELAYGDRFQDWRAWLRDGILDVAVPMAYTPDDARFESLVRVAREAAGRPERVWAGIGAYMNTADGTMEMIDIARTEGAGGVVLFSYDWAIGEGMGDPANPFLTRVGRGRFGR